MAFLLAVRGMEYRKRMNTWLSQLFTIDQSLPLSNPKQEGSVMVSVACVTMNHVCWSLRAVLSWSHFLLALG